MTDDKKQTDEITRDGIKFIAVTYVGLLATMMAVGMFSGKGRER